MGNAKQKFVEFLNFDDLQTTEWAGEVIDNADPTFQGRCRVRVIGKFDGRSKQDDSNSPFSIPDEQLPWAFPAGSNVFGGGSKKGAGSLSVPKVGSKVKIKFSGGNIYAPEYIAVQDVNEALVAEIKDSYQNAHVLLFDEDEKLKVVYTPGKGMEIFLKESHILINPDSSITIEHAETKSIIELLGPRINITANSSVNISANSKIQADSTECILNGSSSTKLGPAPTYSAVLSEPLWAFLKIMASAIDAKLPSTPGVITTQAAAFEQLSTSTNVKVSK